MSLPVFDAPIHSVVLPGSGETVKFRPFLVKEQKQLLMAAQAESREQNQVIAAVIHACTWGKVDASTLASFDVEYLFLQLRARSVGEFVDMVLTCTCGTKTDARLDLTACKVEKAENHSKHMDLGNDCSIDLRYPGLDEVDALVEDRSVDGVIKMIASSIDTIWQQDNMYKASDYSLQELIDFVENLSPGNLANIENFFETMPVLRHTMSWKCRECEKDNNVVLEGIQSFFV
jgi:hypothetical protein